MGEREIKFRARRLADSQWIFGLPYQTTLGNWLMRDGKRTHAIDPATIGQSIGISDSSGRSIYEHDIIRIGKSCIFFEVRYNESYSRFQAYGICSPVKRELKALNSKSYTITGSVYDMQQKQEAEVQSVRL